MSKQKDINLNKSSPMVYQIRVAGHLSPGWANWFEGLTVTPENNGNTLLTGPVVDQAALYGLLRKVRDLGLPLLSITCTEYAQADAANGKQKIRQNEECNDGTQ